MSLRLRPGHRIVGPCAALLLVLLVARPAAAAATRPTAARIHRQLAQILARPEFQPDQTLAGWRRIIQALDRLFHWLGALQWTAPVLYWTLLAGCLVLLALLVGHVAWTIHRVLFLSGPARGGEDAAEQRGCRSRACWEEAQQRAVRAEFTEAIRFLFLALVYRFDETGRVRFQRGATNREYLALFEDRPEVHAELKTFVDTLDEYWYAQRPADRRLYEDCLALYDRLG